MTKSTGTDPLHLITHPACIWDLDRARITNANAAALELWQEPTVADFMEREFDAAHCQRLRQIAANIGDDPVQHHLDLVLPGGVRTMECRLDHVTLNDGRDGLLITILEEITSSNDADLAHLAMAAQNAPSAMVVLDVDGRVLVENKAAIDLFGQKGNLAQRLGSNKQATQMIEETLVQGRMGKTCTVQTHIGPRLARLTARRTEEPSSGRPVIVVQAIDVQDQRAREAVLQSENEALQDFLEAGSDFYLEIDSDLRITRLSPQIADHLGEGMSLGLHWRDLVAAFGLTASNEIEFALGARSGWQDQMITVNRSDSQAHFSSSARVLSSALGDFRGYRIVGHEVAPVRSLAPLAQFEDTSTVQALPRATDHGSDFESILGAAPWAVLIHRDFEPLYINVAFSELVMLTDEGSKAPGDLDLLYYFPEAGKALTEDYQQLMEEDMAFAVRDLNVRRRDGHIMQGQLRARLIEWGGKPAVEYIIEDVSILQRERRAAEQRGTIMSSLLDIVPESMFVLDETGRVEWTNQAARSMLGLSETALNPHDLSDILCPDDAEWAQDYVAGLVEGGITRLFAEGREVEMINPKGEPVPALLALDRIDTGFKIKICAVLRNLSEFKQNQVDMIDVRGEAEMASMRKTEFLASVSHELRTPLTAILGFAEVMSKEELGPMGNERYLEYAKDIVNSGDHLLSLINDLLDMSKIETGNLDLSFGSVDLHELTNSCVKLMTSVARGRQINLHAVIPETLSPVVADERSLRQIILNLISNALRFTEPGGEVQVSLDTDQSGALTLAVADTGVGMTEEELAVALEPFEQVEKAVANGTPGTGLGLPLARALTEANRAYFRIISEPQTGTTVAITFPSTQVLAGQ